MQKTKQLSVIGKVLKLENLLLELAGEDRCNYQQKLLTTRDTTVIFKHLKSLRKTATLPKNALSRGRDSRVHSTEGRHTE